MSSTYTSRAVLLAILAGAAAACAQNSEVGDSNLTGSTAWACGSSEVPMGSVIRCSQGALLIDSSISIDESCTGATDNPEACTSYECDSGTAGCPSETTTTTSGSTSGGTSMDSTGTGSPEECSWNVGLPYCSGSATGDSTTGSSDGSTTCEKNNCDAPGQQRKDQPSSSDMGGSSSGGNSNAKGGSNAPPSASSSSGGSSSGGKTHYKCVKDGKGNKVCESTTPSCAAGSHPSACGACVTDGESGDCVPPSEGGCWVTGGGFIVAPNDVTGAAEDGHDNFGGNAKPMKDGRIQGHWNHVDHGTGNHSKGRPAYIVCRHVDEPGPGQPGGKKGFTMNQVYFGGPAEWRDKADGAFASGYWFDVVAKDHGEPGSVPKAKNGFMPDTYHFTIRKMDDPAAKVSGAKVYETHGTLEGGNIQLHPPNNGHPYTPSQLPGWVSFEP